MGIQSTTSSSTAYECVDPAKALQKIEPGMHLFLTGSVSEPRTMVQKLMASETYNLQDLTLIQLFSFGDAISIEALKSNKYRLKTFFSGWVAGEAIKAGRVDLIPSRFSEIPGLIKKGRIPIDAAIIQITPPNPAGFCSLGVSVDVGRVAIDRASLVIGEICSDIPQTYGDTFVHVSEFDHLVMSGDEPFYFERWPADQVFTRVAKNVASVIEDGSCIGFSIGPLYEALGKALVSKKHLGIHTPFFTDALMDLVKSGAVTNRQKSTFRGKSLTSYALGTPKLYQWLDRNPQVEFQAIDTVFSPLEIGRNPRYISIIPARKVDLSGNIALHLNRSNFAAGPGQAMDYFNGAEISLGGRTVFALPSRNRQQEPNIQLSVERFPNLFNMAEAINMVVTEQGIASLAGRTVRERAQALIDIAHPDDRESLLEEAKRHNLLYADQIFVSPGSGYPVDLDAVQTFKNGVKVHFRSIRPSDEEQMRQLFYRFSDESVFYRYFAPIKTMPHSKMQTYVNVNYDDVICIVGLAGGHGNQHIIAEARAVKHENDLPWEVAFVVDENYQGLGIASYLYQSLAKHAHNRGVKALMADVLATNGAMLRVFKKGPFEVTNKFSNGVYQIHVDLTTPAPKAEK